MPKHPKHHHLVAGILAGIAILALTIFAASTGKITPKKTLHAALVNTLALDSVSFNAALSQQLTSTEESQIVGLSAKGAITAVQSPVSDWMSEVHVTQVVTGADGIAQSNASLDLQVVGSTPYYRLSAIEFTDSTTAPAVEIDEWYRLTGDTASEQLTLTDGSETQLHALLAAKETWRTVTEADSVEDKRQLVATINWATLLAALPALEPISGLLIDDTLQIEFGLSADDQQITSITTHIALAPPEPADTLTVELALVLYWHDQTTPPVAPIAGDTLDTLPIIENLLELF